MASGPTTVGSIKGKAEVDVNPAIRDIERLKAAVRSLDNGKKIRIDVDTTETTRKVKETSRAVDDVDNSAKRATKSMSGLNGEARKQADFRANAIQGLIAISAAIPPVAAAAAAGTVALGGMGVAGALAVAGIARAMKDGTGEGRAYTGMVKQLQGNIHSLQDSAAVGLLPGFTEFTNVFERNMPFLNSAVEEFAARLGNIAPTGLQAVITMIERGMPAWRSAGDLIDHLVNGIADFANSDEYEAFIDYTVRNMPNVIRFLDQVIKLAGQLLAAWAPVGEAALPILTDLLSGIGDVVDATGPLLPAVAAVVFGFKSLSPVIGIVRTLTGAMKELAVATSVADVASALSGGRFGGIGKAGKAATAAEKAAAREAGVAARAGRGLSGMTAGIGLPLPAALAVATIGSIVAYSDQPGPKGAGVVPGTSFSAGQKAPSGGGPAWSYTGSGYGAATQGAKANADASNEATAAARSHQAAAQRDAAALRAQAAAYATATGAAQENAAAAIQSENNHESAEAAIDDLTKSIKENGRSLDITTEKGRANRSVFAQGAASAAAYGKDVEKATGSVAAGRLATLKYGQSMVDAAVKSGMARDKAEDLVGTLLGIPKGVKIKAEMDIAEAQRKAERAKNFAQEFAKGHYEAILKGDYSNAQRAAASAAQRGRNFANGTYRAKLSADGSAARSAIDSVVRYLRSINGMKSTVYVNTIASGGGYKSAAIADKASRFGPAGGGTIGADKFPLRHYTGMSGGGTVSGPGSQFADAAGLYALANGEEVISNMFGQAQKWRPILKAINSGKIRYGDFEKASGKSRTQVVNNKTIAPEIHVHNPVAVDPVTQAAEAAEYALVYAGLA